MRRAEWFLRCFAGSETDLAWVAQLVERVLGKDEVTGSIPVPGSRNWRLADGQSRKWAGAEEASENLEQHRAGVTQR